MPPTIYAPNNKRRTLVDAAEQRSVSPRNTQDTQVGTQSRSPTISCLSSSPKLTGRPAAIQHADKNSVT